MLYYYKSSCQIPGTCEEGYKHENPVYGPSTTDPTFYEPTATRIANMKRAAGGLKGIYDFNGSVKNPDEGIKQLGEAVVDVRFSKHGMTKEEISQVTMEKSLEADVMVSNKKKQKADNTEQLKKEVELAQAVAAALPSSEPSDEGSTSE